VAVFYGRCWVVVDGRICGAESTGEPVDGAVVVDSMDSTGGSVGVLLDGLQLRLVAAVVGLVAGLFRWRLVCGEMKGSCSKEGEKGEPAERESLLAEGRRRAG
jgi:hypothetical protein